MPVPVPVPVLVAETVPRTTVWPALTPETIWVLMVPTTPSVTVTVDAVPLELSTLTLESPAAVVVMAAAGTYNAFASDDFVVMATCADCPRRKPVGMEVKVTVVGKVTTELLAVPVGAIAVTVASAVTPVIAGKVTVAF